MATISFTPKGDSQAAPAAPTKTAEVLTDVKEVSLAIPANAEVAVVAAPITAVGIEGEVTADDIRPPRINLVQKSGNLADEFSPGSFVFEKSIVLAKPGDEINVTVLRLRKYYQEKIEFGSSNEMPPRANTAEEVRALGGSLIYGHDRYFQEVCDVMLAIEAPENLNEEQSQFFAYNVGGKNYTLAMYTVAASAYTSLAKRLFTDAALLLRAGLYTGSYKIHSELRKNGTNSWHVPVASFSGKHDEPTAESFKKLAGI